MSCSVTTSSAISAPIFLTLEGLVSHANKKKLNSSHQELFKKSQESISKCNRKVKLIELTKQSIQYAKACDKFEEVVKLYESLAKYEPEATASLFQFKNHLKKYQEVVDQFQTLSVTLKADKDISRAYFKALHALAKKDPDSLTLYRAEIKKIKEYFPESSAQKHAVFNSYNLRRLKKLGVISEERTILEKEALSNLQALKRLANYEFRNGNHDLALFYYAILMEFESRKTNLVRSVIPQIDKIPGSEKIKEAFNQVFKGNLDVAISLFTTLLSENPNHLIAKFGLITAYRNRGKYPDALKLIAELKESPVMANPLVKTALTFVEAEAELYAIEYDCMDLYRDLLNAKTIFQPLAKIGFLVTCKILGIKFSKPAYLVEVLWDNDTNSASNVLLKNILLFENGNRDEATFNNIHSMVTAYPQHPLSDLGNVCLGMRYAEYGNKQDCYSNALIFYSKARKSTVGILHRIEILIKMKRIEEARKDLEQLKSFPVVIHDYFPLLIKVCIDLNEYSFAIASYLKMKERQQKYLELRKFIDNTINKLFGLKEKISLAPFESLDQIKKSIDKLSKQAQSKPSLQKIAESALPAQIVSKQRPNRRKSYQVLKPTEKKETDSETPHPLLIRNQEALEAERQKIREQLERRNQEIAEAEKLLEQKREAQIQREKAALKEKEKLDLANVNPQTSQINSLPSNSPNKKNSEMFSFKFVSLTKDPSIELCRVQMSKEGISWEKELENAESTHKRLKGQEELQSIDFNQELEILKGAAPILAENSRAIIKRKIQEKLVPDSIRERVESAQISAKSLEEAYRNYSKLKSETASEASMRTAFKACFYHALRFFTALSLGEVKENPNQKMDLKVVLNALGLKKNDVNNFRKSLRTYFHSLDPWDLEQFFEHFTHFGWSGVLSNLLSNTLVAARSWSFPVTRLLKDENEITPLEDLKRVIEREIREFDHLAQLMATESDMSSKLLESQETFAALKISIEMIGRCLSEWKHNYQVPLPILQQFPRPSKLIYLSNQIAHAIGFTREETPFHEIPVEAIVEIVKERFPKTNLLPTPMRA